MRMTLIRFTLIVLFIFIVVFGSCDSNIVSHPDPLPFAAPWRFIEVNGVTYGRLDERASKSDIDLSLLLPYEEGTTELDSLILVGDRAYSTGCVTEKLFLERWDIGQD